MSMAAAPGNDRPLRLMFLSRHCALDRTSGAALTIIELMRRTAARGLPTRIVTATVLDVHPSRAPQESDVAGWGPLTREAFGAHELWRVPHGGVDNVLLRTQDSGRRQLTDVEAEALERLWEREVEDFRPDVVLTFGGGRPERRMLQRLGERGIARVFHLANENYRNAEVLQEVDLIETTSVYLRELYRQTDGVEAWVGAPVIDPARVVAPRHEPRYVTFINPSPAKGAALFYQIAGLAGLELPQAEFLVVESRGHAASLWANQALDLEALPNVTVWPHQQDMRDVYRRTRLLLFPSFWTECFGRAVVEAGWNGIPTVGARHGGIPEAMNGGGILQDVPPRCRQKYTAMPTAAEARPWVEAIGRLLCDPEACSTASRRARAGAEAFDPERVVTALLERLNRLTSGLAVRIGGADAGAERHLVIHIDGAVDGLNLLHPAFRDDAWQAVRVGPGPGEAAGTAADALCPFADGVARAIQADDVLRGLSVEAAGAVLQAIARVLDAGGYAVLRFAEGQPLDREQLKTASERAGFPQLAVRHEDTGYLHCILSRSARSAQEWEAFRSLFSPGRYVTAGGG